MSLSYANKVIIRTLCKEKLRWAKLDFDSCEFRCAPPVMKGHVGAVSAASSSKMYLDAFFSDSSGQFTNKDLTTQYNQFASFLVLSLSNFKGLPCLLRMI